jgi:hypothetical protein
MTSAARRPPLELPPSPILAGWDGDGEMYVERCPDAPTPAAAARLARNASPDKWRVVGTQWLLPEKAEQHDEDVDWSFVTPTTTGALEFWSLRSPRWVEPGKHHETRPGQYRSYCGLCRVEAFWQVSDWDDSDALLVGRLDSVRLDVCSHADEHQLAVTRAAVNESARGRASTVTARFLARPRFEPHHEIIDLDEL